THFIGRSIGAEGKTFGEICFNTGMTGYQETYTDPSYHGQILISTTAHIGNYGVHEDEMESDGVQIAGLVCKKFSDVYYSRVSGNDSIDGYLKSNNVVGIADVDTRALVRHVRNAGAMNAVIASGEYDIEKLKQELAAQPSMEGLELASKVSCKEPYMFPGTAQNANTKLAVLDLGAKWNIMRCLQERGCEVKVFPYNTTFEEIMEWNPDGLLLSNGPGDPSPLEEPVALAQKSIESNLPTFGICLGHQVMALAMGLSTKKMHNGHRGLNHPILNLETGKGETTSQNHGFVVDESTLNDKVEVTHRHLNDQSVAGLKVVNHNARSVQYHPEASAGPHDSRYLFDEFLEMVQKVKMDQVPVN
ncbi:MAG: glutamine-hydrolyzing carbamoyl-phosphate synthase small subunit, partial [Flavobacteriales bacterium]|nr:glutamine-hydrolyzing carbamoyl-phosphate synthase small subunit [Flavobacteriales bacterium]